MRACESVCLVFACVCVVVRGCAGAVCAVVKCVSLVVRIATYCFGSLERDSPRLTESNTRRGLESCGTGWLSPYLQDGPELCDVPSALASQRHHEEGCSGRRVRGALDIVALCAGKDTSPLKGWIMQVAASEAAPENQPFVPESVTAAQTINHEQDCRPIRFGKRGRAPKHL